MSTAPLNHCSCEQGRAECNCIVMIVVEPVEPDLPLNSRNLAIALVVVAFFCALSSLFPWGFAQ